MFLRSIVNTNLVEEAFSKQLDLLRNTSLDQSSDSSTYEPSLYRPDTAVNGSERYFCQGPYKRTQTAALDAYFGSAALGDTSTIVYCDNSSTAALYI